MFSIIAGYAFTSQMILRAHSVPLDHLEALSISFSHITFMAVFISDMEHFSRINQIYKKYFGSNPPGRACVTVDLPGNLNIKIDCLAYAGDPQLSRKVLHVQGLSYWAPANIGPYSQAVTVCYSQIIPSPAD